MPQAQRCLRAALQIAPHEAVLGHTQFQCRCAGLVAGRATVLLGLREHAQDAADANLGLSLVDSLTEGADGRAGLVSPRQQLMSVWRRAPGTVSIEDAMSAALLPQMFT